MSSCSSRSYSDDLVVIREVRRDFSVVLRLFVEPKQTQAVVAVVVVRGQKEGTMGQAAVVEACPLARARRSGCLARSRLGRPRTIGACFCPELTRAGPGKRRPIVFGAVLSAVTALSFEAQACLN